MNEDLFNCRLKWKSRKESINSVSLKNKTKNSSKRVEVLVCKFIYFNSINKNRLRGINSIYIIERWLLSVSVSIFEVKTRRITNNLFEIIFTRGVVDMGFDISIDI